MLIQCEFRNYTEVPVIADIGWNSTELKSLILLTLKSMMLKILKVTRYEVLMRVSCVEEPSTSITTIFQNMPIDLNVFAK